jgi:hypothetical protein
MAHFTPWLFSLTSRLKGAVCNAINGNNLIVGPTEFITPIFYPNTLAVSKKEQNKNNIYLAHNREMSQFDVKYIKMSSLLL